MKHPRIEFGVGGESTIHPQFFDFVETLRKNAPKSQLMVQTNIDAWIDDGVAWMKEFYGRGGNILTLNCYQPGIQERVVELLQQPEIQALDIEISGDYYGKERQEKHISPYYYKSPRTRQAYVSPDMGTQVRAQVTKRVRSRAMTNHAGSVPDKVMEGLGEKRLAAPMERGCMWPSKQMVMAERGQVLACCYDQWLDKVSPGKFPEQSLGEIWDSETFWLLRALLSRKNRNMLPCATCDYHGGFGRAKHPLQIKGPIDIGLTDEEMMERMTEITAEQIKTWEPFQFERMIPWRDMLPEHIKALIPKELPQRTPNVDLVLP